uniref:60S ribosomal protein L32 n=1 Tax=Paramoeba aestuarina TaxID=180227 RepID=A0A6U3B994_9EUKA|mmetsp:Transcript_31829/g.49805  ORF Transcript_31829/g.49805 Transcript_31829/m.49805 type:complete len:134 (+) Transcript_31829:54-455(+)
MVLPASKPKIVKKRTAKFVRFESDRRIRVKQSWRKPRGIDNCVRRRFKGTRPMPKIGYGSNKKTRNMLPSGFLKFRVSNVSDLNMLLMHNKKYAAEISSKVSTRKRREIIARAAELNVKVINKNARLRSEEQQ